MVPLSTDGRSVESGNRKRKTFLYQNFLLNGGFPEIQGYLPHTRIKVLQEYVHTVIYRDIVDRYNIGRLQPLKRLLSATLNAPATLFSVNNFYNHLKSQQIPCRKDSLYEYLEYLHDAYLLFPVRLAARSEKARQVNPAKIYPIDTGLAHAHSRETVPDWGHLLETFVFLELRKRGYQPEYYKTKNGYEVDFVVQSPYTKIKELLQVSVSVKDDKTKKREIRGLEKAMAEQQLTHSSLITADEQDNITTESGKITIIPAWLWAIQLDKEQEGFYSQGFSQFDIFSL